MGILGTNICKGVRKKPQKLLLLPPPQTAGVMYLCMQFPGIITDTDGKQIAMPKIRIYPFFRHP